MIKLRRVLCPVDFSAVSHRALHYAIQFARNHDARVELLHVIHPLDPSFYVDLTRIEAMTKKRVDREMQKLLKAARTAGVEAEPTVRTGEIESEIQRAARQQKADVIVMGKHSRSRIDRWFIGSTTDRLLRQSTVPLLIIGEGKVKPSTPSPKIRRIVVTTDLSEDTESALAHAISLGQDARAKVLLLHVVVPAPVIAITPPAGFMPVEPQPSAEQFRQELESRIPSDARSKCVLETRVEFGEPYLEILNVVKETRADLLVMNIHGKGRLERALLGSTAERVIRGASCPVLAIPPRKKTQRNLSRRRERPIPAEANV